MLLVLKRDGDFSKNSGKTTVFKGRFPVSREKSAEFERSNRGEVLYHMPTRPTGTGAMVSFRNSTVLNSPKDSFEDNKRPKRSDGCVSVLRVYTDDRMLLEACKWAVFSGRK